MQIVVIIIGTISNIKPCMNNMKTVISIVGARPQFIKLSPLSKRFIDNFNEIILHTGQHYNDNMSNKIFNDLKIKKPDYNLNIGSASHGEQTGKMIIEIEKIIIKTKPDVVIVFGDTNSTLAGALVASKLNIPSIHIEAGLRSFNMQMPEEINRITADHICSYLFAPTQTAINNLENENLGVRSYLTGDIMVDTLWGNLENALTSSESMKKYNLTKNNYFLLTLHRPYNVDNPKKLINILERLSSLPQKIVFPVHPRTRNTLKDNKINLSGILFIEPQGYLDFLNLQYNAEKILTDSGGVQKEAYILHKPCITLRSETEWVETITEGWNKLLNVEDFSLNEITDFNPTHKPINLFGENPTDKMLEIIKRIL